MSGCRANFVLWPCANLALARYRQRYLFVVAQFIAPHARTRVYRITSRYHPRCPTDKETRPPYLIWECGSLLVLSAVEGLPLFRLLLSKLASLDADATTAPSSFCGNALRTMRSRDDLPAGGRLLVRGIAQNPHASRRNRMPLPELSACQDRSDAESRQSKRSVKLQSTHSARFMELQSIWTVGPPVVPATSARRAATARATL